MPIKAHVDTEIVYNFAKKKDVSHRRVKATSGNFLTLSLVCEYIEI